MAIKHPHPVGGSATSNAARPGTSGSAAGRAANEGDHRSECFPAFEWLAKLSPADVMLEKDELAEKLKVTVRSIENWQHDGFLPFIKIGNAVWFYWPDVILHLLKHHRVLMPFAGAVNLPAGNGGAQ